VGDALFGADGADHLLFRIQIHLNSCAVVKGNFPAQVAHAAGNGVAMGFGVLGHFAQLADDRIRGRVHGVSHAQIDDILAVPAALHLHLVDHTEQVRGQLGHAFGKLDRVSSAMIFSFSGWQHLFVGPENKNPRDRPARGLKQTGPVSGPAQ
jgi:hypothetical protein